MSIKNIKNDIYNELIEHKIFQIQQFDNNTNNVVNNVNNVVNNKRPYLLNQSKIFNFPILFDNITLYIENIIKTKNLTFDKLCACSVNAIPFVTNVSTTFKKPFIYIKPTTEDNIKYDLKNIKIEGQFNGDENILLIETITSPTFYLENILHKLRKYGSNVIGLIIIFNLNEGEYINLIQNNEIIFNVVNITDILSYMENNNLIDIFYSEQIKHYYEKRLKHTLQSNNNI